MSNDEFERESLAPKPFVFVVMPFDKSFNDIYKFGIKGAADEVGAYAERLDDQIFTDGILDRVFNQISRADVIVADMTGRNANVFYEVGYAHALGKIVLLLTQKSEDIPFDLQHRQHLVYGDSIETLRRELKSRIAWGIREASLRRSPAERLILRVTIDDIELAAGMANGELPSVSIGLNDRWRTFRLAVRNESRRASAAFSHLYLFTEGGAAVAPFQYVQERVYRTQLRKDGGMLMSDQIPHDVKNEKFIARYSASPEDSADGLNDQYRLPNVIAPIPSGAVEYAELLLGARKGALPGYSGRFRLRLQGDDGSHDFAFLITALQVASDTTSG